jgi:hypothetical protein
MPDNSDSPFGEIHADIERVIDINSAKVFNIKADILHRDSILFKNEKTVIEVSSPVPVHNDENEVIGSASLCIEKDSVVADIYLDPATPERLSLETGSQKLWPHVGYRYTGDNSVRITSVLLMPHAPLDTSVMPLNA